MTASLVADLQSSRSESRVHTMVFLLNSSFFPFSVKRKKRRRKRKKTSEAAGCFEIYKEGKNGQTKVCLEGSFTLSESGMPSLNKKGRKAKE